MPLFVLGGVMIAGVLGVLAGHAPDRIRAFGLFSVAFGLFTGWLMTLLAANLHLKMDRPKLIFVGLVTLGGLITYVCQTVVLLPPPKPQMIHPLAAMVAEQMRKSESSSDSSEDPAEAPSIPMIQPVLIQPPGFASRVQAYLHRRVNAAWSTPWPELLWTGEVAIGVAGSIWIAHRLRAQESRS